MEDTLTDLEPLGNSNDRERLGDAYFNKPVYSLDEQIRTSFYLNAFQICGTKNGNWVKRIHFECTYDSDPSLSGVIDGFDMEIEKQDGGRVFYKLDGVEPEQLFWAGWAFMKMAERFGVTHETMKEEWDNRLQE